MLGRAPLSALRPRRTSILDILLVEDDPADVYLIRRALADCCPQGRVWVVSKGSDALAFLRHEPPFMNVPTPALILSETIRKLPVSLRGLFAVMEVKLGHRLKALEH